MLNWGLFTTMSVVFWITLGFIKTVYSFKHHTVSLGHLSRQFASTEEGVRADIDSTATATADMNVVVGQVDLLVDLWKELAFPDGLDDVDFSLSDYNLKPKDMKGLLTHFQNCRDCAGDGGILLPSVDNNGKATIKLSKVAFPLLSEDQEDGEGWGEDVLADLKYMGYEDDELEDIKIFPVEPDDTIVLADTREWVRKMIADFAVCPYTMDAERAGVPLGQVRYTVSRAHTAEEAFFRYWEEVQAVLATSEKNISTVLLVFPELELFGDYELFDAYVQFRLTLSQTNAQLLFPCYRMTAISLCLTLPLFSY